MILIILVIILTQRTVGDQLNGLIGPALRNTDEVCVYVCVFGVWCVCIKVYVYITLFLFTHISLVYILNPVNRVR